MHCIECICIGTGIFYYLCAQRSLQNQKFPAVTIKINFLAYGDFGPHGLQAIFGYLILYANCHLSTIDVVFQQISTFVELSVTFVFGLCVP